MDKIVEPELRTGALMPAPVAAPRTFDAQTASGLIAALVACGLSLLAGLASGWSAMRLLSYGLLALIFVIVTTLHNIFADDQPWAKRLEWAYLLSMGLVALLLQTISGDPVIQPAIFTILIVNAAMCYSAARTALVGLLYLGLIALGLWLSGHHAPEALLLPVLAYGTLSGFMYAFTRMAVDQAAARQQADVLAQDLARERDYLSHLVDITATLTRELDLTVVLEHVALAGRTLARAEQVLVWLCEVDASDASVMTLRQAAAVPPQAQPALTASAQQVLLRAEATVSESLLRLPLLFKREVIGVLELRAAAQQPFSAGEARLLQPFVDAATIALANARLYEQVRLAATLAERNRLGRELHDTIAQGLTAVSMQLAAAQRGFERDPARAHARLERAASLTRETLEQVRRSVWTLSEPVIEGETLSAALEDLATRFVQRTGLVTSYHHAGPAPALSHTAATQVLRIVQEALHNVEKHAGATEVQISSCCTETALQVVVQDNGIGFDLAALPAPGSNVQADRGGFGLLSLRERARLTGGTLEIETAPGAGTAVRVTLSTEREPLRDNQSL